MSWKDDKGLGPWTFSKSTADNQYNEGNLIATAANPVWSMDRTGVPITPTHDPCGYWVNNPVPDVPVSVGGSLYVAGKSTTYYSLFGPGTNSNYLEINTGIPASVWTNVYGIGGSTVMKNSNGELWGCGRNRYGVLGLGHDDVIYDPWGNVDPETPYTPSSDPYAVKLDLPDGVVKDYNISSTSVLLLEDGTIWTAGLNDEGALGVGDLEDKWVYTQESLGKTDWKSIFSRWENNTYGIDSSNTLWGCGTTYRYELGYAITAPPYSELVFVPILEDVATGCSNTRGCFAIRTDGSLYFTGRSFYYANGLGVAPNYYVDGFTKIGTDTWTSIDATFNHSIGIKTDGTMWGCGLSNEGQLGLPASVSTFTQIGTDTDWVEIKCSSYFSIAKKTDGSLWSAGRNIYQIPLGLGPDSPSAVDEFTKVPEPQGAVWLDYTVNENFMAIKQE